MTFYIMFVHIIYSSVKVAEWPPFGKEMILIISHFGFDGLIWVLIAPVPVRRRGEKGEQLH